MRDLAPCGAHALPVVGVEEQLFAVVALEGPRCVVEAPTVRLDHKTMAAPQEVDLPWAFGRVDVRVVLGPREPVARAEGKEAVRGAGRWGPEAPGGVDQRRRAASSATERWPPAPGPGPDDIPRVNLHWREMSYVADEGTVVGHVHLKVSDLERSITFYRDVLGFELQQRFGDSAAFLGAGGYHHHVGLNTWQSAGGPPAPRDSAGLFHAAFLYPTRRALAEAVNRVVAAGVALTGASDHGVSEAVYLDDPDGNGLELYVDRPREEWPRSDRGIEMFTRPLDLGALLGEAAKAPG